MGEIVNRNKLSAIINRDSKLPVIICNPQANDERSISDASYKRLSLNLPLAEALISLPETERPGKVQEIVFSLLPANEAIYLADYEMLFDHRYEINVMKLFCEISRRNRLVVKWCGRIVGPILIFAEPGYSDYEQYRVRDYGIICVI